MSTGLKIVELSVDAEKILANDFVFVKLWYLKIHRFDPKERIVLLVLELMYQLILRILFISYFEVRCANTSKNWHNYWFYYTLKKKLK